jgi:hypothetical protein
MARGRTQDCAAYQLNVKGRYLVNKRGNENIEQSLQLFEQAIDADPSYRDESRLVDSAPILATALIALKPRKRNIGAVRDS